MSEFRKGDRISVPGIVRSVSPEKISVAFSGARESEVWINSGGITLVERAQPNMGDKVCNIEDGRTAIVLGVRGDWLWLVRPEQAEPFTSHSKLWSIAP